MKKCNKGYTLLELLVVIGLIGVVSVPLMMSFTTGYKIFTEEENSNKAVSELRVFVSSLTERIRRVDRGDVTISGNSIVILTKKYYLNGDTLISEDLSNSSKKNILNDVESFKLDNIILDSDNNVVSFSLEIVLKEKYDNFSINTSFYIRGE